MQTTKGTIVYCFLDGSSAETVNALAAGVTVRISGEFYKLTNEDGATAITLMQCEVVSCRVRFASETSTMNVGGML